ncbi:MAG TPA: FAD-binding protein, partial [Acidimicrobiales bacterium]|nr:FAD-binding protein [Acidimicrobiales bacterium]
ELEHFSERFPTIAASVTAVGLDPSADWLPIAPAAHYLSGGIVTDLDGASSLPGLWACGEAACTGVHGANRLASNSLLEGMVFAPRVVEAIVSGQDGPRPSGAMRAVLGSGRPDIDGRPLALRLPPPDGRADVDADKARHELQRAMTTGAGVLRSAASLDETCRVVAPLAAGPRSTPAQAELANLGTVAWALLRAASERHESRGSHTRTEFPHPDDAFRLRLVLAP